MKKILLFVLLFLGVVTMSFCLYGATLRSHLAPENSIPPLDIVFTSIESSSGVDIIGFVDQNGKGLTSRRFYLPETSQFWGDMFISYSSLIGDYLIWSSDGYKLSFLSGEYVRNRSFGYPNLVSIDGKFLRCKNILAYNKVMPVDGTTVLIIAMPKDFQNEVILYDMSTCRQKQLLYKSGNDEILENASLSSQGLLAIGINYIGGGSKIKIISPNNQMDYSIEEALSPSWSKDGDWLVYYSLSSDNLSIIDKSGIQLQGLHHKGISSSWSPDGKWIVYSRDGTIYKLNVETDVEHEIAKGKNPNWRWEIPQ